jgi:hypothetical protein
MLVNNMGQPFTSRAYGNVVRAFDGENISYCLGDASNAYYGFTDDPMWHNNFKKSNVEESVENGFGPTPLKIYRRHVLLLHPDKVVIYDELEADSAASWEWLLHSPVQFTIDEKNSKLVTKYDIIKSASTAQIFSNLPCIISQTDQFVVPPDKKKVRRNEPIPNQWHLTASFEKSKKNRILTIIQITPDSKPAPDIIKSGENTFDCDKWKIQAELDVDKPAGLTIENADKKVVFSYGNDNPIINGAAYKRKESNSSLLFDVIDGNKKVVEVVDRAPHPTR